LSEPVLRLAYPPAPTAAQEDDYHGTRVADPYRPLEDADAPETRAWIEAQNRLTEAFLADVPLRDEIRARVTRLWDHPRAGAPWRRGDRWFQMRNSGLQNQDVLWTMDAPDGEGRVLLDPNELSADGTVSLTGRSVSDDGRWLAYGTSAQGSDWVTWRVRDVATGADLDDVLEWSKFSDAAWLPEGSGFFYARYAAPAAADAYEATNRDQRLYLHRLGTAQADDRLVYERPDHPDWGFMPRVTEDGRYLVLHVWQGTDVKNRIHYVDLAAGDELRVIALLDEGDARYDFVGNLGARLFFLTDADAPHARVIALDLKQPARERWQVVVPEADDALEQALLVGGRLVAVFLHHARHRVALFATDGSRAGEVALPGIGAVSEVTGRQRDPDLHFLFSTFTAPPEVRRSDVRDGGSSLLWRSALDVDPDAYVTEQVFASSVDGTRVPLFLVRRRDLTPDGQRPTLLYGYGGFHIAVTPQYKVEWLTWLELGGVLAVANLRGGGEYGKAWHDAGRLASKQNVFDDFIACAEWLVASGWTRRERLGIHGRSNGGLLVGASLTQRPELFGAAVAEVGVMDMLRFHRFTIGWAWTSDYGSADDPEQFGTLLGYSPLHNVRPGTRYPPTLLTTGDHDDRVVPGHTFKFAAALQAAHGGDEPILVRIETDAGHGVGKPTSKLIEERTDVLAFLTATLGV
jgi:prolyl oligopeptidase